MMNALVALTAFSVSVFALSTQTADPCAMCEYVMNQAEQHFRRAENITQLAKDLQGDCATLQRFYGDQAVQDCARLVTQNLDLIYADLQQGKQTGEICQDMGQCIKVSTTQPPPTFPCPVCEAVLNEAKQKLGTRINDEQALLVELLNDCYVVSPAVAEACIEYVSFGIDIIYADLTNGKDAWQTCADLHVCFGTEPPMRN
ncbi:unnamed protein product, partial [Mesorhabditis belari]|uniref:Saposin B-type domain-containing protein n=1 Tax=Mesorhabditis belari TaxID=2138241 RepID=A0AAF3F543_9BILA